MKHTTKQPKIKRVGGRAYTMAFKKISKSPVAYEAHATILTIGGQHVGFFAPTSKLLQSALTHLGPEVTGPWVPEKFMRINITSQKKK